MDIATPYKTIGICIGQVWEQSFSSPTFNVGTVTPAAVQRTVIDGIVSGIRTACDEANLQLLLYPYSLYKRAKAEDILENPISGLILVSSFIDPRADLVANTGLPIVLLNRFREVPTGCASVFCIEGQTVDLALSYLWRQDHRRIAYLAGSVGLRPEDHIRPASRAFTSADDVLTELRAHGSDTAVRRLERTTTWLEKRNVFDPSLIALTYDRSEWEDRANIRLALARWIRMPDPPTAIFCGHEGAAIQLLEAARDLGIRVPEDLSLIGVDTDSGLMGQTNPPLTSVRWPATILGAESVRTMVSLLQKDLHPDPKFFEFRDSAVPVVELFRGATTTVCQRPVSSTAPARTIQTN